VKNITLSADEHLIEGARERARDQHTTLNSAFRTWLRDYTRQECQYEKAIRIIDELRGRGRIGRKLTRDEMNER